MTEFPDLRFRGQLRPSQSEVVTIARKQLAAEARELHIVAPPGSGKTILGLTLWAEIVRQPCLVLSPNSAIQAQWVQRLELFEDESANLRQRSLASTDPTHPAWLTSLTYQSLTLPARDLESIDAIAIEIWIDRLMQSGQAASILEAQNWLADLRSNNLEYYGKRLATYQKQARDDVAIRGDSLSLLHTSSRQALQQLADQSVGFLILDECHHLMGHWGRVLADALPLLNWPIVLGLTATPADRDKVDQRDQERYDNFFGPIDYEVPIPAVVKDGFLAPYQDLVLFVRPADEELKYVATVDSQLDALIDSLCSLDVESADDDVKPEDIKPDEVPHASPAECQTESDPAAVWGLQRWIEQMLVRKQIVATRFNSWAKFEKRDPQFAKAARQFLVMRGAKLPEGVPELSPLDSPDQVPAIEILVPVLDRFVRHYLRVSRSDVLQKLAEQVVRSLRLLGHQITETGCRPCASPVGRVIAYSRNKAAAAIQILQKEMQTLGDKLRAVVVADYEKTSAVREDVRHLLDDEAGGAMAAFRILLTDPSTQRLEPVLLTGSTLLVDSGISANFLEQSRNWFEQREIDVELSAQPFDGFHRISGVGGDWCPREYVALVTELFQRGLSRCLVGTRGLLGEGWDANRLNVLIDLTTVTTSMSINQLRGRSIRLDPQWPEKVANNWDVVCLAPEFTKGFDDYHRFIAKHRQLYGVTDDGLIEKGVGHVHPALSEIQPEAIDGNIRLLNDEMLTRAGWRNRVRDSWRIGQPYRAETVRSLDVKMRTSSPEGTPGFPPFASQQEPWNDLSLTTAIGNVVLQSLIELGKVKPAGQVTANRLAGGFVRAFLRDADNQDQQVFSAALQQVLEPLDRPRYVIERMVEFRNRGLLARLLPEILGRYFVTRSRQIVMLHAIPDACAANRKSVELFSRHWNRWVSPGKAMYARQGSGRELVRAARQSGESPSHAVRQKEIFH